MNLIYDPCTNLIRKGRDQGGRKILQGRAMAMSLLREGLASHVHETCVPNMVLGDQAILFTASNMTG